MKQRQFLQVFIIAALVLGLFGGTATSAQRFESVKAQPVLIEMAAQNPGQNVRVIVQKMQEQQAQKSKSLH